MTKNAIVKRATLATVDRVQTRMPSRGDYYVVFDPQGMEPKEEDPERLYPDGELIYVESIDDEAEPPMAKVCGSNASGNVVIEDLLKSSRLEENPQKYLAGRIHTAMTEMAESQPDLESLGVSDPKLLTVAVCDTASQTETSGLPALTNDPTLVKKRLATARNTLTRFGKDFDGKRKSLEKLLDQQSDLLATRVKDMTAMIKRFEEGVWTINLYLGKNEEITRIKDGKAAPKETPITIRQQVLFMDEESAALAEKGGITADTIPEFVEWVTASKKNLNQLLPEPKGLVAIKPRRHPKKSPHDSSYTRSDAIHAQWDRKTYFLMRNGEKLYLICPDLEVRYVIIPHKGELDAVFERTVRKGDETVVTPIRPGTERWMEAMERADSSNRHYMRILLFLQGLLDRTVVFQPLPRERLNVFNESENAEFLRLIRDDEMLLATGRESYGDWIARVNGELEVGHRVIGDFDSYYASTFKLQGDDEEGGYAGRISPKGAALPRDEDVFTIDEKKGGCFLFHFARFVNKWERGFGYVEEESKTRGAFKLVPTDGFFINFDRATVDEAKFYLTSRTDRHNYLSMMPLLHQFIRLKDLEVETEAPFKLLLIGDAMKRFELEQEDASRRIDELVLWWKLKNTWKRALSSDDRKAYDMIMAELEKRLQMERRHRQTGKMYATVVSHFRKADPNVVYIAHRSDGLYVTLSAHNRHNLFVRERTWRLKSRVKQMVVVSASAVTSKLVEDKVWRTVDSRRHSWFKLWQHPERWAAWRLDVRRSTVLSDDAIASLITQAEQKARDRHSPDIKKWVPLAVYWDSSKRSNVAYLLHGGTYPHKLLLSTEPHKYEVDGVEAVSWKYAKGGHVLFELTRTGVRTDLLDMIDKGHVEWYHEKNVEILRKEVKRDRAYTKRKNRVEKISDQAYQKFREYKYAAEEAAALKSWLDDHNDPDLWPDEKKHHTFHYGDSRTLARALSYLAERGLRLIGMTVGQALDKAFELGMPVRGKVRRHFWNDSEWEDEKELEDLTKLPRDFVFALDKDDDGDAFDAPAVSPEADDDDNTLED